ncbi:site-specific integrase [Williamsia sp. 1138]|uniref:site-specific integrase n=1 Tax=Williamsia sp. 1138 TaxID=1903117 RepID=UPI000A11D3F4|nr:site-specific integrase [Williamsia sp. 1138]OZG27698.1 site-specific integrase [Williamsia sp. 1138]
MAYIRAHETNQRRNGKAVKRYEVVWTEPVRDAMGLPVSVDPTTPTGKKRQRSRQESYATREAAEERRDQLNAARRTATGTATLADQRKAGDLPIGHYAREFIESMRGTVKPRTVRETESVYLRYIAEPFGGRAVASVTAADVRHFRADLLSPRPRRSYDTRSANRTEVDPGNATEFVTLSRSTVKHAYDVLRRILDVAVVDGAIHANPVHSVPLPRQAATARTTDPTTGKPKEPFKPLPLTGAQVAAVAGHVAETMGRPIDALAVTFSAYTGVRAGELRGLEIGDLDLTDRSGALGSVSITRTKTRRKGGWEVGTPKSVRSTRIVPIDGWLADDLRTYLAGHPRRLDPAAPLFPGRMTRADAKAAGVNANDPTATVKWSEPINTDNVSDRYYTPALAAVGAPAARWHDLRHTFAVLSLSAGEHYMQVSKWLGHASFVTTLNVYADYISEAEGGKKAPLTRPELAHPAHLAQRDQSVPSNVVSLFGR